MDPRQLFADERNRNLCVYCGGVPSTRDHVPSRILLDEPFPDALPVVDACLTCNAGFSMDEEYLACFLDCVLVGSVESHSAHRRSSIGRILSRKPALASRIAAARSRDPSGRLFWFPEEERVRSVLLKLARGHAAFELSEPQMDEPQHFVMCPLEEMSNETRLAFEEVPVETAWPEIGSRAFVGAVVAFSHGYMESSGWTNVQSGRYRYLVSYSQGIAVRIVLSEYLACEVLW